MKQVTLDLKLDIKKTRKREFLAQIVDFHPNLTPHFNPILTPPIAV
jgi:hypothetical protein